MTRFTPLPRCTGRIDYLKTDRDPADALWGYETFSITRGEDGLRVLQAHTELETDEGHVTRDLIQSSFGDAHPHDASVRLMVNRRYAGHGWYRFTDTEAECLSWIEPQGAGGSHPPGPSGRFSEIRQIARPLRGFGTHAVQADAWLVSRYPFREGPGVRRFENNLLYSTHHLGADGPAFSCTTSSLSYIGEADVTVPAGTFHCHHIAFGDMSNGHPAYELWVTTDPDSIFVRGVVGGYLASAFELVEFSRT
jgi:hypothetical protein